MNSSDNDSNAGKRVSGVSKRTAMTFNIKTERSAAETKTTDIMKQFSTLLELEREKKMTVKNIFEMDYENLENV